MCGEINVEERSSQVDRFSNKSHTQRKRNSTDVRVYSSKCKLVISKWIQWLL